jgi:hypothetical protein
VTGAEEEATSPEVTREETAGAVGGEGAGQRGEIRRAAGDERGVLRGREEVWLRESAPPGCLLTRSVLVVGAAERQRGLGGFPGPGRWRACTRGRRGWDE